MESSSGNFTPPVNNALLPDIYNKLDADLQERTRVINTQLDKRLVIQEKVLSKYQRAAERIHTEEKIRMRQELARISSRLPAVGNIKNFNLGFFTRKKKPTRKRKGIPDEKEFLPFCERHFIHHLPTKRKFYRKSARSTLPPMGGSARDIPGEVKSVNGVSPSMNALITEVGVNSEEPVQNQNLSDVQLKVSESPKFFPASR